MKSISILHFLLCFLAIYGCQQKKTDHQELQAKSELKTIPAETSLGREKAGLAEINMPIDKLDSVFGSTHVKKSSFEAEGQNYEAYFVYKNSADTPSLRLEGLCNDACKVWRIKVLDNDYRTETGLGIGSTVKEIKSYHIIDWVGNAEATPGLRIDRLGITFQLDSATIPTSIRSTLAIENLPDTAKVKSILITEASKK